MTRRSALTHAAMNNKRFGIIALSLAGLVGLGYIAYQANRAPSAAPAAAVDSSARLSPPPVLPRRASGR